MEVSQVRQRVLNTLAATRARAHDRRQRAAETERAYLDLLAKAAGPLAKQIAQALKAEHIPFTVSTPERSVRLTSDHRHDDVIELALDAESDPPRMVMRIRRTRGSRVIDEERPIDRDPAEVTESELLDAWLGALAPWLER